MDTVAATVLINDRQYTDDDAQALHDHTIHGSKTKVKKLPLSVPPAPEIRAIYIPREHLSPNMPSTAVRNFVRELPTLFRAPHGCYNSENEFEALLGWRWPRNHEYHSREYVGRYILCQSFFDHPHLPTLQSVHHAYLDAASSIAATCFPLWSAYLKGRFTTSMVDNQLSFFSSHSLTLDIGEDHVMHQHDDVGPTFLQWFRPSHHTSSATIAQFCLPTTGYTVYVRSSDAILYNGNFYHHTYRVAGTLGVYGCAAFNKARTLNALETAALSYQAEGRFPPANFWGTRMTEDDFVDLRILKPRF